MLVPNLDLMNKGLRLPRKTLSEVTLSPVPNLDLMNKGLRLSKEFRFPLLIIVPNLDLMNKGLRPLLCFVITVKPLKKFQT